MEQSSVEQELGRWKYKPYVSAFIIVLLCVGACWLIPDSDRRFSIIGHIRPLISYFGFWQTNNYFAPDVPKSNIDLRVTITCADGKVVHHQFPRLEQMNPLDRIIKTPYRKFAYDYMKDDFYKSARPDFARFIARQFASSNCAPNVVAVDLFSADTELPQVGLGKGDTFPPHRFASRLIEYSVQPSDLQ